MNKHLPHSKSERTRKYIIATTAPIFNTKGYAGTSISDLTSATRLTKGSIYGNFANKDEIAMEAFKFNLHMITSAFSDGIDAADTSVDKLLVYPRTYRTVYKRIAANGGCPVLNTLVEADDTNPVFRAAAIQVIQRWKQGIIRLIKDGITCGEIMKTSDPERIAENMITLFEGGGILAKTTGQDSFMHNALDQVEDIIRLIRED